MIRTIRQDKSTPWICAVLLLIISFPQWLWGFGADIITLASFLLLFIAYKDILQNNRSLMMGSWALLFQLIIIFVTSFTQYTNINGIILLLIRGFGFATIFFCSADFWKRCLDCFIKLLAVLLVFALIEHIIISYIGINTNVLAYAECPTNPNRDYYIYIFNAYLTNSFDLFNRFYAFYDEPGVLGNIMMVMLYIQEFNLKKWYNIVFLISGLLSFSLAFYISVATYFILFGSIRNKVLFAIALIGSVYYFYNNEVVYKMVFERLEFEDGQLLGYNRENTDFQYWIESKSWTEYLFWGYQPRDAIPYAASWKWAFALYGIIPSLLYLFTITYPRIKNKSQKSDIFRGLVLMVIIWIQRPFIYSFLYVFLIVIPFIYYKEKRYINYDM